MKPKLIRSLRTMSDIVMEAENVVKKRCFVAGDGSAKMERLMAAAKLYEEIKKREK